MSLEPACNGMGLLPNFSSLQPLQPWGEHQRCAAVCVLLVPSPFGVQVILTRRSHKVRTHKGQISFPGGMREPFEATPLETAIRELREEVGAQIDPMCVHGQLPPLISRHGLSVIPVVLSGPVVGERFLIQEDEVAEVLTPHWSELSAARLKRSWLPRWCGPFRGYRLASGHWVWGLTAEILKMLNFQ